MNMTEAKQYDALYAVFEAAKHLIEFKERGIDTRLSFDDLEKAIALYEKEKQA